MKIIGHRGARGMELENSPESIRAALRLPIDAIEFDIHRTRDNALVVMHDRTTGRVANQNVRVNDVSLAELRQLKLRNGQSIPLLEEILQLAGNHPVYIDIKDTGCAEPLVALLRRYPAAQATFVSGHASELQAIRQLLPAAPTYLYFLKAQHPWPRPIHMVRVALSVGATGLSLDKLIINPLTYHLARRHGLRLYAYSVGSVSLARLLHWLYPELDLCTSHPEQLARYFQRNSATVKAPKPE